MSEGQKAAGETKSVFKEIGQATEDLRQNINSYADNLVGGDGKHESTGIHPDAKKIGEKVEQAVSGATEKSSNSSVDPNKPRTTTT